MYNLLISYLLISCIGIIHGNLIGTGCNGAVTCLQFSDCSLTTSPATLNLATIYTVDNNTVRFQLQYDNSAAGWIGIGLSTTASMADSYIFLCHRSGVSGVTIQERYATGRSRPSITTSYLTELNYVNYASTLNCTFTTPVTRTPELNYGAGYYVLLAWGAYDTDIEYHTSSGRCYSTQRRVITDALGAGTITAPAVQFIYAMAALLITSYYV
ncbi:Ferric-chelate reductase 1 isoform X2 [Oopsacas minuta]|uniref:Ferric-chelate reductase 1 isoform X2 n=1 Tax=Oopsacas minuta TaxID=111878 RepID=A0AAV7JZ14_9METZ|nr:Ferric-chelate reductase 1 isoform X2 [Oopsacas minuta]